MPQGGLGQPSRKAPNLRANPDARGVIESEVFPVLRLDVAKLMAGDLAGVLAELEARPSEERPERQL